jgi:hypothetical protein
MYGSAKYRSSADLGADGSRINSVDIESDMRPRYCASSIISRSDYLRYFALFATLDKLHSIYRIS